MSISGGHFAQGAPESTIWRTHRRDSELKEPNHSSLIDIHLLYIVGFRLRVRDLRAVHFPICSQCFNTNPKEKIDYGEHDRHGVVKSMFGKMTFDTDPP